MRAPSFHGAMRPGSDGRALLDVRHLVEMRCGRVERTPGQWSDAWRQVGDSWVVAEFAHQQAEALRAQGHTVRVRPVLC